MSAFTPPPNARRVQAHGYALWVRGAERTPLNDAYHAFLRANWAISLLLIAVAFFLVNLGFAVVYYAVGGIAEAREASFFDALAFSVQTLATIGYGVMHPTSAAANTVVIIESIASIVFTALATGLVFAKFARATARVAFTSCCVITQHEGKPTLMFRVGNRRSNTIVEASVTVGAGFLTKTAEGTTFYKLHDLTLVRDRMAGMRRGWTVMHVIDEASPFHQCDEASLATAEVEIEVSITGIDDVAMQTIHAIHGYTDKEIKIRHRFVDTLTRLSNGDILLDLSQFDAIVPDGQPRDSVAA